METITSVSNQKVKDLVKLFRNRGFRDMTGLFAVEGAKLAKEACLSSYEIAGVFFTKEAYEGYKEDIDTVIDKAGSSSIITAEISDKISVQVSAQGIFTVLKQGEEKSADGLLSKKRVILLDNISDPTNLGAIVRSALAFGYDSVFISKDSADRYSPKSQRAAMGALLKSEIVTGDTSEAVKKLRDNGFIVCATVLSDDSQDVNSIKKSEKIALIIGNESVGLSKDIINACDAKIKIDIDKRVESLNASAAAAVLMYCLRGDAG